MDENIIRETPILNKRILWLDALKGIGIMMVMTSHMLSLPYDWILYIGFIPFFFIASGYTYRQKDSLKILLEEKTKRLLIPYIFYTLIAIVVDWGLGFIDNDNITIRLVGILYSRFCLYQWHTPDNITFLHGNGPLWFLPAMFLSLSLVYVFNKVHLKVLLGLCYFSISVICLYSPILLPWSLDVVPIFVFFIFVGYKFKLGG